MKIINKTEYAKLPKETRDEVEGIFNDLSPENLSCDGELPGYKIKQRRVQLINRLKKIEAEIGGHLSENFVYDFIFEGFLN